MVILSLFDCYGFLCNGCDVNYFLPWVMEVFNPEKTAVSELAESAVSSEQSCHLGVSLGREPVLCQSVMKEAKLSGDVSSPDVSLKISYGSSLFIQLSHVTPFQLFVNKKKLYFYISVNTSSFEVYTKYLG